MSQNQDSGGARSAGTARLSLHVWVPAFALFSVSECHDELVRCLQDTSPRQRGQKI